MANSITADKQLIMLGSLLDSFISECEAAKQDLACIHNIPVEKIDLFPDHPYYVDNDEDMANLVRSIKAIGQISPGITRVFYARFCTPAAGEPPGLIVFLKELDCGINILYFLLGIIGT